ncbi:MAG: YceI family protein [Luteimonas sp.]
MSRRFIAGGHLLCLVGALLSATALATNIDPAASTIGFALKTRWGQTLQGRFPHYQGEIATLADGRHQVRLRLSARDVEIVGNPNYTRFTRGPGFFDVEHYRSVSFVSDAYPAELMISGGPLAGELTIRGRQQREIFTLNPSSCDRPAVDCDVVAAGSIRRSDYGVDRWGFAISDRVRFSLRVRVQGDLGR